MIGKEALKDIPESLRKPLLTEYRRIVENYLERNWIASELSGGRFCEIVYSIVSGFGAGKYPLKPDKPRNFVDACRKLESVSGVPHSMQILIPRLLLVLYDIRNNRNVGHVGGEVDSNFMDASAVVAMTKWLLAELICIFHNLDTPEAQKLADSLAERTLPIFWKKDKIVRILETDFNQQEQILLLASNTKAELSLGDVMRSIDSSNKTYTRKLLAKLHGERLVEFDRSLDQISITPKGSRKAEELIARIASIGPKHT